MTKPYFGEPGGTRTHGPKIKSLVLYHLSYGLTPSDTDAFCTPPRRMSSPRGRAP